MDALIKSLSEKRSRLYQELKVITDTAAAEHRELTPREVALFDSGEKKMDELRKQLDYMQDTDRMNREAEENLRKLGVGSGEDRGAGHSAATTKAFDVPEPWLPSRRSYFEMQAEQRAVSSTSNGAVLQPVAYGTWFDKLRTRSVVLAAGPRLVPVDGHSLVVPVVGTSATISATAENTTIADSSPDVNAVTLTPTKYAAMVKAANEALEDSNPQLLDIISTDLLRSTATKVDADMLAGNGTSGTLTGLRNLSGTTAGPSLGANGAVPTLDNILTAIASLEATGADITRAALFMTSGVWSALRAVKTTSGYNSYVLNADPTMATRPNLFGVPVFATANLPQTETQGTSNNASTIILADMDQVIVGVGKQVSIEYSPAAGFGADQTWIRCLVRLDIKALNPAGIVVTKGALAA